LRKICTITFTLLIFTAICRGQIPRSGNAFFGYSYSGGQVFNPGPIHIAMNGWEGTLEGKFLPWLGGVADFDWHYGGATTSCIGVGCQPVKFGLNGSRHSVLFGPRVSTSVGKYTPFSASVISRMLAEEYPPPRSDTLRQWGVEWTTNFLRPSA
jgi:hypothetical protein